jgi:hypothetical protein
MVTRLSGEGQSLVQLCERQGNMEAWQDQRTIGVGTGSPCAGGFALEQCGGRRGLFQQYIAAQ